MPPADWARLGGMAAVASLVALHLGFFWRAALLRGYLLHSDICYQFDPFKALLHESLRAGRLPLWSPYIFCGYPIAGEGQIAAFYPPSLLVSWLLPSPAAINWLVISHLLLAAISMYLLARGLGASPFPSWLSAVTFSFSGYLFAHLHHVGIICAAAWLPLTVLFVDRACRGRLLPNAPLAALSWAACALCGHPQTLFLISLTLLFWVGWRLTQSFRRRETKAVSRAAALLAIVFLLGPGLAAVQLLLTADLSALAPHGQRGDLAYVTAFSLLPRHLLGLVAPNWQGSPAFNTYRGEPYYWEYVLYLGLLPLLLAVIGGASRPGRPLAGFALVAILLALARTIPAYDLLRFVPGFADFRVPARFVFLFTFAAALLAGRGWMTIAGLRFLARGRRLTICAAAVAALTILDLAHFARPLAPLTSPQVADATPRVVQALRQDEAWGRSLILPPITIWADWLPPGGWARNPDGWIEARAYLPASVPQSFRLHTISGYAGFIDPDHEPFFSLAIGRAVQAHDLRLLSLVGTRYIAVPPNISIPGLPSAEVPPFKIYRNAAAFPRVFLVSELISASSSREALLATIALAGEDRLRRAAVVQGVAPDCSPTSIPTADLAIEQPRPERVVVRADASGDSLLVLNERWDPGWIAHLDGRPAPLLTVDTVLMGTPLPQGRHTVEFSYRPRGLILGRAITLISLALCVLLIVAGRLAGDAPRAT